MKSLVRINEIFANSHLYDGSKLLKTLYLEFGETLYKTAFRILHSPDLAAAAVGETLETVWRRQREIAAMKHPAAWVLQCARHKALNILRAEKRRPGIPITGYVLEIEAMEAHEELEEERMLWDAIERLPVKQRKILLLKYMHGMGRKQIATACGISEHTVRNHLTQAQLALRHMLE